MSTKDAAKQFLTKPRDDAAETARIAAKDADAEDLGRALTPVIRDRVAATGMTDDEVERNTDLIVKRLVKVCVAALNGQHLASVGLEKIRSKARAKLA